MKKLILLLIVVFLSSCYNDSQETIQNGNFKVEYLFEQNGCKMYRFRDGGRFVYWSDCQGKVQSDYESDDDVHHQETITTQ